MLKDTENDVNTEVIESDMTNDNEKLLKHPNFAPTLSEA
jgi:hypothetical protein